MKVTVRVTKSSNQDRYPCYLQLRIFFLYICTLLFYREIKSFCDRRFPQQIRPQATVQLCVL